MPRIDWAVHQRVMLPDAAARFVDRPALLARCDPLDRRATVIHASAGFGKTTLMAAACRRRREAGNVVAWLTLEEDDAPSQLASYLGLAFAVAGLDVLDQAIESGDHDYLVDILMRSIEAHGADCVLALDDLHALCNDESAALVDELLRRAPPNLHFCLAGRAIPAALDVASLVFDGRGEVIATDDLRFGDPEIAAFFDGVTGSELSDLIAASQGWPIALRMLRNARGYAADATAGMGTSLDALAGNWIDTHLWRGLARENRDLVFAIGQLDWIDREVVDDLLGTGSFDRFKSLTCLDGLAQSIGDQRDTLLMHPLIRDHCRERLMSARPAHYRSVHGRIADILAGRGHVVAGMRHAAEAGDPRQVGRIAEDAGGFRLWLENGLKQLRQVNELLTRAVLEACPRLWLIRCLDLTMRGKVDQATAAYVNVGAATDGFTRHRDGGKDPSLEMDHLAFRFVLAACGCRSVAAPETRTIIEAVRRAVEAPIDDPVWRAALQYGLCWTENMNGNLEAALTWAGRAVEELGDLSPYMRTHIDLQKGSVAMAQGRIADAVEYYAKARQGARSGLLADTAQSVMLDVLTTELEIERIGHADWERLHPMTTLAASGATLYIYDAATEALIARGMSEGGPAKALEYVDEVAGFAAKARLETLSRCVSAMRVSLFVMAGRPDAAQRAWAGSRLPDANGDIASLESQTWREMEAVSCARLRLLTAQSRFDSARELAQALLRTSRQRGLRRTEMRGLALAVTLEHAADTRQRARARLVEYLELYRETPYARSLIQERGVVLDLLEGLTTGSKTLQSQAASLGELLRDESGHRRGPVYALTPRERQVLGYLERWRNKEIAHKIGLSEDGVRYHIKNIYRKLGTNSRSDAVRRARAAGML